MHLTQKLPNDNKSHKLTEWAHFNLKVKLSTISLILCLSLEQKESHGKKVECRGRSKKKTVREG